MAEPPSAAVPGLSLSNELSPHAIGAGAPPGAALIGLPIASTLLLAAAVVGG